LKDAEIHFSGVEIEFNLVASRDQVLPGEGVVNLAAGNSAQNQFLDPGFQGNKEFGKPELELAVTVVDRGNLNGELSLRGYQVGSAVAGHAGDHNFSFKFIIAEEDGFVNRILAGKAITPT
jgi:hypothetical protein